MFKKLIEVQNELKAPKNQRNKFGKYNYRSCEDILEAVKPLLKKHGLTQIISDDAVCIDGWHYIKSTITLYCNEDGKELECSGMARESETKKGMDAAQITGSASSYARKYALNGLYAIDDTKDADSMDNKEEKSAQLSVYIIEKLQKITSIDKLSEFKKELQAQNKYTKEVQKLFTKKKKSSRIKINT
jgi:hypothetical protein